MNLEQFDLSVNIVQSEIGKSNLVPVYISLILLAIPKTLIKHLIPFPNSSFPKHYFVPTQYRFEIKSDQYKNTISFKTKEL